MQGDGDLVGAIDHMVVGDDDAGGVDDEAGPQALRPAGWRVALAARCRVGAGRAAWRTVALHEVAEEPLEGRAGRKLRHLRAAAIATGGDGLAGGDVDHRRQQFRGQIGEAFWRRTGLSDSGEHRQDRHGEGQCQRGNPGTNVPPQRGRAAGKTSAGCMNGNPMSDRTNVGGGPRCRKSSAREVAKPSSECQAIENRGRSPILDRLSRHQRLAGAAAPVPVGVGGSRSSLRKPSPEVITSLEPPLAKDSR